MIPHVLTIAGSDPSAGAGIQADLKTFYALSCYGMSVITALTAQNTQGVSSIHDVPASFVSEQIEAIFRDIRVDAVKVGMIGTPKIVEVIVEAIQRYKPAYVVLDPVMVAQSGDTLVSDDTIKAMKELLLPMIDVVTPNIPEGEMLSAGEESRYGEYDDMPTLLLKTGARAVLLKGGHDEGPQSNDIYLDKNQRLTLEAARIDTKNNHGTGCTLSAALAAYLAKGLPEAQAAQAAKKYITKALQNADKLDVGHGHGPVHHFFAQWDT